MTALIFDIGAAVCGTMGEDYQAVLDRAGYGKRVSPFPAAPAIWALRMLERLGISPLDKWVYETAAKDSLVAIDEARQHLGWKSKFSYRDALLRNVDWYVEHRAQFASAGRNAPGALETGRNRGAQAPLLGTADCVGRVMIGYKRGRESG